jgi:hypothetical protein
VHLAVFCNPEFPSTSFSEDFLKTYKNHDHIVTAIININTNNIEYIIDLWCSKINSYKKPFIGSFKDYLTLINSNIDDRYVVSSIDSSKIINEAHFQLLTENKSNEERDDEEQDNNLQRSVSGASGQVSRLDMAHASLVGAPTFTQQENIIYNSQHSGASLTEAYAPLGPSLGDILNPKNKG